MDISLFDYELDKDLIAQFPCSPRDSSRLLSCLDNVPKDFNFKKLPEILNSGDILVINNTKVIPSRLFGQRDNVNIEVTLHLKVKRNQWRAFAKPGKKCKVNDELVFKDRLKATVIKKFIEGDLLLEFNKDEKDLLLAVNDQGVMPLPPYIKRENYLVDDKSDYQTIFASNEGAVAAPTAGLHFTDKLILELKKKGIIIAPVTLHVGAGTFLPVKVENVLNHKMHEEWGSLDLNASDLINRAIVNKKKIIALGTTSLRILETIAMKNNGKIIPWSGFTKLFITPGFDFNIVDILITNFHLPKSTLLMLVSAFHGRENLFKAYDHAIKKKYRFFSFGDSCIFSKQKLGI